MKFYIHVIYIFENGLNETLCCTYCHRDSLSSVKRYVTRSVRRFCHVFSHPDILVQILVNDHVISEREYHLDSSLSSYWSDFCLI